MAASTATAYRKSPASESGNFSRPATPFSRVSLVRNSSLPYWKREKLASLMARFNASGDDLFMEMEAASVVIGRVSTRRERICRRAVQYFFAALVNHDKVLRIKTEAGSWIRWQDENGNFRRKFRRTRTYELVPERLTPRETYQKWVEAGKPRIDTPPATDESVEEANSAPATTAAATAIAPPAPVTDPTRRVDGRDGITRQQDRLHKRRLAVKGVVEHFMSKGMTQDEAIVESVRMTGHTREEIGEDLRAIEFRPPDPPKKMRAEPPDVPFERNPWKKILRALKANMNPHSFETWLAPTRLDHETAGTLFVRVPTEDFLHIGSKFADLIQNAINSLGLEIADLKFVTDEEEP